MRLSWNGEAAEECGGIVQGNPLQHLLDFSFYFYCPIRIVLFFIGGKLVEQSQKLSHVYKFLVRSSAAAKSKTPINLLFIVAPCKFSMINVLDIFFSEVS